MSEYRDDLAAAHRRIAQLEEVVAVRADRAAPRRSPARRLGFVVAVILFPCVGAVAGLWGLMKRAGEGAPPVAPAAILTTPPRLHASWYAQPGVLPTTVDVDGDGTKDYVGLFSRTGQDEGLYAASIDGKTFALTWSAGPFPPPWNGRLTHLTVARDSVIVSLGDPRGDVRILDLRTGNERASVRVPGAFLEMCPLDHVTARAVVRWSLLGEEHVGVFDAENSTLETQQNIACRPRYAVCAADVGSRPCFHQGPISNAPREAQMSASFYVTRTAVDGDLAIAIGTPTGPDRGEPPQAVAFVRGSSMALWKASLLATGDDSYGDVQTELGAGKLVSFYQTRAGRFRLVSRDARTARVAWTAEIGGDLGSKASAFGVDGDRVLVVVNQTAHVFDAVTGVQLAALDGDSL